MADNVAITPGSGVSIASDEVAGAQYQRVKLSIGADGSAADAPGDATDGYKVQAKLLAGTAEIGKLAAGSAAIGVVALGAGTAEIGKLAAGTASIGAVSVNQNAHTRISARVALSASQTGGTVWTPTSGKKFALRKLVVSCATAGAVQFFDGTDSGNTVIGPVLTLSVGGGWTETWDSIEGPYLSAAANNLLKYTSGAGFTGSVYVEGWEV